MGSINEDRLFKLLPDFFSNPAAVIIELAQNAERSGASNLAITLQNNVLQVEDNGEGCGDVKKLLVLAESGWSQEVEENELPAGWGLFFLISLADNLVFTSRFGSIDVNCNRYLNERDYRETVINQVDPDRMIGRGFMIKAILKPGIAEKILRETHKLRFFPLMISVNGEPVKHEVPGELYNRYMKTTYQGNDVYISTNTNLAQNAELFADYDLSTIWYGIPVEPHGRRSSVVLDVQQGTPVTPVLPYRHTVKNDERLEEFYQFVRSFLVEYAIAAINGQDVETEKVAGLAKLLSNVGTQEELDRCTRWYAELIDEHYQREYYDVMKEKIVLTRESRVFSEEPRVAFVKPDGSEEETDVDEMVLPQDTIRSASTTQRHPDWVDIETKEVLIRVIPVSEPEQYDFAWQKVRIECEKAISCLETPGSDYGYSFYYTDTPSDVHEITSAVFAMHEFREDGDTWGTQEYEFEERIKKDIEKLTSCYNLYDLFKGFPRSINTSSIRTIRIDSHRNKLVIGMRNGTEIELLLSP